MSIIDIFTSAFGRRTSAAMRGETTATAAQLREGRFLRVVQSGRPKQIAKALQTYGTPVQRLHLVRGDVCDADGKSALHWAAEMGRIKVAAALLRAEDTLTNLVARRERGVVSSVPASRALGSLSVADVRGSTPLHLAASGLHVDVVELLLEHATTRADHAAAMEEEGPRRDGPRERARRAQRGGGAVPPQQRRRVAAIRKALLNARNDAGWTPLIAAAVAFVAHATRCTGTGTKGDGKKSGGGMEGRSAVLLAQRNGRIAAALARAGANAALRDKSGFTASEWMRRGPRERLEWQHRLDAEEEEEEKDNGGDGIGRGEGGETRSIVAHSDDHIAEQIRAMRANAAAEKAAVAAKVEAKRAVVRAHLDAQQPHLEALLVANRRSLDVLACIPLGTGSGATAAEGRSRGDPHAKARWRSYTTAAELATDLAADLALASSRRTTATKIVGSTHSVEDNALSAAASFRIRTCDDDDDDDESAAAAMAEAQRCTTPLVSLSPYEMVAFFARCEFGAFAALLAHFCAARLDPRSIHPIVSWAAFESRCAMAVEAIMTCSSIAQLEVLVGSMRRDVSDADSEFKLPLIWRSCIASGAATTSATEENDNEEDEEEDEDLFRFRGLSVVYDGEEADAAAHAFSSSGRQQQRGDTLEVSLPRLLAQLVRSRERGVDLRLFCEPWALPGALASDTAGRGLLGAACRVAGHILSGGERRDAAQLAVLGAVTRGGFILEEKERVAAQARREHEARERAAQKQREAPEALLKMQREAAEAAARELHDAERFAAAATLQRAARVRFALALVKGLRAANAAEMAARWAAFQAKRDEDREAASIREAERFAASEARRKETDALTASLARADLTKEKQFEEERVKAERDHALEEERKAMNGRRRGTEGIVAHLAYQGTMSNIRNGGGGGSGSSDDGEEEGSGGGSREHRQSGVVSLLEASIHARRLRFVSFDPGADELPNLRPRGESVSGLPPPPPQVEGSSDDDDLGDGSSDGFDDDSLGSSSPGRSPRRETAVFTSPRQTSFDAVFEVEEDDGDGAWSHEEEESS